MSNLFGSFLRRDKLLIIDCVSSRVKIKTTFRSWNNYNNIDDNCNNTTNNNNISSNNKYGNRNTKKKHEY